MFKRYLLLLPLLLAVLSGAARAQDTLLRPPAEPPSTDRIIVKWRDTGIAAVQIDELVGRTARLQDATGIPLRAVRALGPRLDVVRVDGARYPGILRSTLLRLAADPGVEYAEPDERIYPLGTANDPRFLAGSDALGQWLGQWYLKNYDATVLSAINATAAWDRSRGLGMRIAVIDSGVRLDHPDLAGHLLAGYDFVCNDNLNLSCTALGATLFLTAGDGDSWDADPNDPGDGLTAADLLLDQFRNNKCGDGPNHDQPIDSTWHGTRVAGLIAAVNDNNIGIASVAPDARVIPVRALGKCAGYTSDLVAAMLWAGGIGDSGLSGIPTINQRAHILNLSLGNRSDCSTSEQAAVDKLLAAGVVVVAAAGNDGGPIGAPANCKGVLSVAGVRHAGTKVGYSNVSSSTAAISIAAPAGNCINISTVLPCVYAVDTLTNEGKLTPLTAAALPSTPLTSYTYALFNPGYSGNKFNYGNVGTSFAAPLVSGVVALMGAANGNLTPTEIIQRLQKSARSFPAPTPAPAGGVCHVATGLTDVQDSECTCTTASCGAGLLDAAAAVNEALRPIALIKSSATSASIGQRVSLDGSTSLAATGSSIASFQWSASPSISITGASSALAEFVFPATRPIAITLVVTDIAGRQDTATLTVDSSLGSGTSSGSGGGGGSLDTALLGLLASLAGLLSSRRRRTAGN
jgi:serine protease